ncbi:MAG: hypothetical protein AB7H97_15270, partial [Pseudobdellovibrionaceae bacterium]
KKVQGKSLLSPRSILETGRKFQIPIYVYTGALDSLSQVDQLKNLTRSSQVKYTHFPDSGHAGWLFEPQLWQQMMEN